MGKGFLSFVSLSSSLRFDTNRSLCTGQEAGSVMSRVQVEIFAAGDGINYPKPGNTVTVHYTVRSFVRCLFGCVFVCVFVCMFVRMYVCMYVCMDGWMDGWIDGWMDGYLYVWLVGWLVGWWILSGVFVEFVLSR